MAEQQDPEIPDVPEHDLSEEDMMFVSLPYYLVHTNGECRALNQRAKRRHFCLLFQKCRDLLSNVTL